MQAKSLKNGTTLKSKHLLMSSIPSVSSINRILRSYDNTRPMETESTGQANAYSATNNTVNHSTAISNSLNHSSLGQTVNNNNNSTLNSAPSLNGSTSYSTINQSSQNGHANDKNMVNLNTLNLLNTIKQEVKLNNHLKNDSKEQLLSTANIHQLYRQNSTHLNSAQLNGSQLNAHHHSTQSLQQQSASVQNLLQMSSSQLLMVNQSNMNANLNSNIGSNLSSNINSTVHTINHQAIDHLNPTTFQQLASSYLHANLNAMMANSLLHAQPNANQTNPPLSSNLDQAAFLLNQMQHRLLPTSLSSTPCSSTSSSISSLSNSMNNKQLINSVNNLLNSSTNAAKPANAVQEPLTLSTLVHLNNLNSSTSCLNNSLNSNQISAMNNLLLTTKPNMFAQLLQQSSMLQDPNQLLMLNQINQLNNHLNQVNDRSPNKQSKKYSSYNIADILMGEYKQDPRLHTTESIRIDKKDEEIKATKIDASKIEDSNETLTSELDKLDEQQQIKFDKCKETVIKHELIIDVEDDVKVD